MKKYIVLLGLLLMLVQVHAQTTAKKTNVTVKEQKPTLRETLVKLIEDYLYDEGFKNQVWTRWENGKVGLHIEADIVVKIPESKLDFHYNNALQEAKKIKEQVLKKYVDTVGDVALWFVSNGVYIGAEYPSGKRITERLHKD